MKIIAALLFVVLFAATVSAQKSDDRSVSEIRKVLDEQVAAWNQGSIEGFMEGYWRSEKTTFSGRNLTRGWQTVLENYKKNYDTREKMGKLSFGEPEITPLSKDAAYVFGTWKIEDGKTNPGGRFTLIFRRFKEGWRIVHDHTS
ncbi:MAG: nuclear transport factor 2 family protein [Acidobacteriota bacterium]|nr:nuclear transport factor 2 family protein [Acidobacteriota bacterium]